MSNNRDDKPAYIFGNAETLEKLNKKLDDSGTKLQIGHVLVTADIIPYGYCVVVPKEEFLGWLFAKGNDHDVWTIPEEDV